MGMEGWFGKLVSFLAAFGASFVVVFLLLIPPRWDPTILWKEDLDGWPKEDRPAPSRSDWTWTLWCLVVLIIVAGVCGAIGLLSQ
jgi:hypothetical protein